MEYAHKINQNSFELSSGTESYLLGLWYIEEKIKIVVIKNDEKYERTYLKEDLQLSQSITQELVNELKELIQLNPKGVEISMKDDLIAVNIKKDNELYISFKDISIKVNQPIETPIQSTITEKKKEQEIDPQTLNMLCEYLNKLDVTISSMEKRLNVLSDQINISNNTNTVSSNTNEEEAKDKNTITDMFSNVSNLEKKLQNVEEQINKIDK